MDEEAKFTQALYRTIEVAKKHGYVPTYFMQMLAKHGAINTAHRLLAGSEPQTGLFELWKLGILNESLEAVICDNRHFQGWFDKDELDGARHRLEELNYFKK